MGKDYNSPVKLVIKCNRAAADSMLPLLKEFRFMGNAGCSRSITIENYGEHERDHRFGFDGDGPDKIDSIEVDGKLIKASGDMLAYFVEKFQREGLYKKGTEKKFDPAEVKMGMEVEKEHTNSPELLREIVLDHLMEDPKYYTKLKKMEGQMEKAKKMPIGTISRGRKKVAEGRWVPVSDKDPVHRKTQERIAALQKQWRSVRVSAGVYSNVPGQYDRLEQIEQEIKKLGGKIPVVLPTKWKAAAKTYGVSEETLGEVKAKGYNLGSVTEALRHLREFRGVSMKKMKNLNAGGIGALARQVREGRAQSKFKAEHQARTVKSMGGVVMNRIIPFRKGKAGEAKMKKSSIALVLVPGELTKAAKLSGVGSGHPAGLSGVGGKIKSKIPYTSHTERMKLAQMAARRMLGTSSPEDESEHTSDPTVDRKGRVKGAKPAYSGYATGVSGMESQAHDIFGRATIVVKPSEIGSSAPEGTTKHTPVSNVRKPNK